jgi:putative SOS response-associated peptidase YedK
MCGRFTANVKKKELEEEWNLAVPSEFRPRYNIAPSQLHPVIVGKNAPVFNMYTWGLVPEWIQDLSKTKPLINTRIESLIDGKVSLHTPCLIPATSWFEWMPDKARQPFLIKPTELKLFAFAGICHKRLLSSNIEQRTFSIVTTEAAKSVADIHHRMPLIIEKEAQDKWLQLMQGHSMKDFVDTALKMKFEFYPVSSLVNKPVNDVEEVFVEFRETLF